MTDQQQAHFIDDRHALYVGWVRGIAHRHHVPLEPVFDEAGNYTDRLSMTLSERVTLTFVVPPPPDDWSIDDE